MRDHYRRLGHSPRLMRPGEAGWRGANGCGKGLRISVKQGGAGLNGKYRLLNTAQAADGLTPNDHDEDSEAREDRRHH
jgi:hypothetical protein